MKSVSLFFVFLLIFSLLIGCTSKTINNEPEKVIIQDSKVADSSVEPDTPPGNEEIVSDELVVNNEEDIEKKVCHSFVKLEQGVFSEVDVDGSSFKLELRDLSEKGADILVETQDIHLTYDIPAEYVLSDGKRINLALSLIRDGFAYICINTGEEYDISYCENKDEYQKGPCFDNLGYLYGVEYCEGIPNEDDRTMCVRGALGQNG